MHFMPNKLIVLSVDSLFDEDMALLKTLPNFGKLIKRASFVQGGMRSVYPSFTYPAHASIITGTYPEFHGIYHNEKLDVGNPAPDWYWFHRDLKVPTLIDAAKGVGLTTCSVGWPCMGGCANADWLVAEIWPETAESDPHAVFSASSSKNVMEDGIFERHYHKLRKTKQPFMDHFMVGCTCDILRRYRPDVLFLHLAHLDHTRHANGLHGPAVEQAIIANDDWLGRVMEATMDTGDYESTNFALISDHGHLAVKQVFHPNVILAQNGLIALDENAMITDWRAYCNSTSLSCQVVMRDPEDAKTRTVLERLLYAMREDKALGVESVFTKEEAQREWHLTGDFEYVLEGENGTSFGAAVTGPLLAGPDNSDYKFSIASHGHLPYKGAQPIFIMAGPDIRKGVVLNRQRIIDEAPTFASLLGIPLPAARGRVLGELLKTNNEKELEQ